MIIFVSLIDSIYLSDLLTRFTINSYLQYLFILCYFFVLFFALILLTAKRIKKKNLKVFLKRGTIISFIGALLLVFSLNSLLWNHIYKQSTLEILATRQNNLKSKGSEVWVTDVLTNGSRTSFDYLPWSGDWILKDGALLSSSKEPQTLKIKLPASKNLTIKFLKHEWSGTVQIKDGYVSKTLDLYSKEASSYEYKVIGNINNPPLVRNIADILMAFILFASILFMILVFSTKSKL